MKKIRKTTILFILLDIIAIGGFLTVYLVNDFKNWFITSAMTTMNHQYLAKIFYSDQEIEKIMNNNYMVEINENTDTSLVQLVDNKEYIDEFDKEILDRKEGDLYKLITINENGYDGYLVAIYDPSKISVVTSKYIGQKGQYLVDMAKENNAVIAINGGGFIDEGGVGNGGTPAGIIIQEGKIINASRYNRGGGLIGFTNDHKLFLGRLSAEEAINQGIRDAVEFGPFLIVNGKSSFINGNGGYGIHPRTAIAQRKDGIVLFLVIDGRRVTSMGADMDDLVNILLRYHAYNAANLDGGNSSALVINNRLINNPINWDNQEKTRPISSGFIVRE